MNRRCLSRWVCVLSLALLSAILTAQATAPSADPRINALIRDLGAGDPARRDAAQEELRRFGQTVRPMLLRACESESPEVRARAGALLVALPWFGPEDPPQVRTVLVRYGRGPAPRVDTLRQLGALPPPQTRGPLLRILREEPSLDVAWAAAALLARQADELFKAELRELHLERDSRAPSVFLAARAWETDPARAVTLFRRAVALQAEHPSHDGGELGVAFAALIADATHRQGWDEIADLLREQAWLQTNGPLITDPDMDASEVAPLLDPPTVPPPVLDLFALHAAHGPLRHFERDLQTYAPYASQPPPVYAIGRLYQRSGQQLLAEACYRAAFVTGAGSQAGRYATAVFLIRHGWLAQAEPELAEVLCMDGPYKAHYDSNAHLRLAFIAERIGDDFSTAEHLRLTMELLAKNQGQLNGTSNHDVWVEIHWRYFRAARDKRDEAATAAEANEAIRLVPTNVDVVLDLVPWLRDHGRNDEARALFTAAYVPLKATVAQSAGTKLEAEKLNNLAWLCACCNENLEEAAALSARAVKLSPDNAAYLDTAAEASFRLGHRDEAVRLESRALKLKPDDAFMAKQLERFRK